MPKTRWFHSLKYVALKGDPSPEIHPSLIEKMDGVYWLLEKKFKSMERERKLRGREARRAARPLRGPGSGRAGGGRGAAHYRFHLRDGSINHDTKPGDCPLCFGGKLWKLWLETDYGRLPGWLDALRPSIGYYRRSKRWKLLGQSGKVYQAIPSQKWVPPSKQKPPTLERLEACDDFFDGYMRAHRFEGFTMRYNVAFPRQKPEYRYAFECDVFAAIGCPGRYDRPPETAPTHDGIETTPKQVPSHGGEISMDVDLTPLAVDATHEV